MVMGEPYPSHYHQLYGCTHTIIQCVTLPKTAEEKAVSQNQEAVQLAQEHDDDLDDNQEATLILFFGENQTQRDHYIALKNAQV